MPKYVVPSSVAAKAHIIIVMCNASSLRILFSATKIQQLGRVIFIIILAERQNTFRCAVRV